MAENNQQPDQNKKETADKVLGTLGTILSKLGGILGGKK